MPAYRLLDTNGFSIGSVTLEHKNLERELLNGNPNLRLYYTKRLDEEILSFTLEAHPPS